MVLVYADIASPRLYYITHFLFRELLGIDAVILHDAGQFREAAAPKISYSETDPGQDVFHIVPSGLLSQEGVKPQNIECFEHNGKKAFFRTTGRDFPFDILSATFYLLTRYEEYLPHTKDEYGRYAHSNSLAFKEGFLQEPLINYWAAGLAEALQHKYPEFRIQPPPFHFQPTYDIDMAFSYKHKGLRRNAGGFLRRPSIERIAVLLGLRKDPFDAYEWMNALHEKYSLKPVYFFLVAEKNGRYDKNILLYKNIMWRLIKFHAVKYMAGLHPSWQSGDHPALLKKEKEYLEAMSETVISRSRQHYIRFDLPDTYRRLAAINIKQEYSMGYGSINGFRASVANAFYWYDLQKEEQTVLRVHPFCFMDANSLYEQKNNPEAAYAEMLHYYACCKKAGGTMITIWHNSFLGTATAFNGWREVYEKFIAQLQP